MKMIIIFLSLSALVCTSCKKDGATTPTPNPTVDYTSLILGKWTIVSEKIDFYQNNSFAYTYINPNNASKEIEFRLDGTYTKVRYAGAQMGLYQIKGDSLIWNTVPDKTKIISLTANSLNYTSYIYISANEYRLENLVWKK